MEAQHVLEYGRGNELQVALELEYEGKVGFTVHKEVRQFKRQRKAGEDNTFPETKQ